MIHRTLQLQNVRHERTALPRCTTSAVLLFTGQQPTRTPRTTNPRAHYTSLTFIAHFVLWLLDFRFLAPFADDKKWYTQRKTQQSIGTEHDYAFGRSSPVSSSVGTTHPYVCSNNNTMTSGTPTRREYGRRDAKCSQLTLQPSSMALV